MNYQNGKIYTIRSHQTDKYYIGSTCSPLSKRIYNHKRDYQVNKKYISSSEIIKYDDAYIELLEIYPCRSRTELHKREGELIREHKNYIVNNNIPSRSKKEYYNENKNIWVQHYQDNKDILNKRSKENRDKNKETYLKYQKQYREKKKLKDQAKKEMEV